MPYWTTSYKIYFNSVENAAFQYYTENGAVRNFTGNVDQNTTVTNLLTTATLMRTIIVRARTPLPVPFRFLC